MLRCEPTADQLPAHRVDRARHHAAGMHIQPDARTLRKHRASRKCRHYRPGCARPATHDNLRARPGPTTGTYIPSSASVRQPVQLVRQGFGDGTDAAV